MNKLYREGIAASDFVEGCMLFRVQLYQHLYLHSSIVPPIEQCQLACENGQDTTLMESRGTWGRRSEKQPELAAQVLPNPQTTLTANGNGARQALALPRTLDF